MWVSAARNYQYLPMGDVGLRSCAAKLRARRLKSAKKEAEKKSDEMQVDSEAGKAVETSPEKTEADGSSVSEAQVSEVKKSEDEKSPEEEAMETETSKGTESEKTENADAVKNENTGTPKEVKAVQDAKNNDAKEAMDTQESIEPTYEPIELLNVTEALLTRSHYPKVTKPHSKMDQLLERRQKQWELEQRQKMAICAVIDRYKKQELERKAQAAQKLSKGEELDVVGDKASICRQFAYLGFILYWVYKYPYVNFKHARCFKQFCL